MSIRTVQTCEKCGASRDIPKHVSPDLSGWRTIRAGALEATFCNDCIRLIVNQALDAAKAREPS